MNCGPVKNWMCLQPLSYLLRLAAIFKIKELVKKKKIEKKKKKNWLCIGLLHS